jgi:hypothetical protein
MWSGASVWAVAVTAASRTNNNPSSRFNLTNTIFFMAALSEILFRQGRLSVFPSRKSALFNIIPLSHPDEFLN